MRRSESTAPVISEDDEQHDDWMPVISDQPETSANVWEIDSDTSSITAQRLEVRSRQPPPLQRERERFEVLDNWEGVVKAVEGDFFFASMRHTNSEIERAEDEFEVHIDNVARGDRELVRIGAIFYLTVGIRHPRGEGPQKTTQLIFRRMPRWSSRDIARAEAAATELWEKLNPGAVTQTTESNQR